MKTLFWIFVTLTLMITSVNAQTITFDEPLPATPTITLNINASYVHICGGLTNRSVLLTGNGVNSGTIEIALPSPIDDISLFASTNQPGQSGKVSIQGFDQNNNPVGNATNYDRINTVGCPATKKSHTFPSAVWKVRISKHTGSASDLYIDDISSNSPLPVELVSFSGHVFDNRVKLLWKTATETNNYGFEIQRKVDLNDWKVVGFVMGHGTSSSYKSYSFSDGISIKFSEMRYRLRQIDRDGTFSYSNELVFSSNQPIVSDLSIYPNPSSESNSATVSFSLTISEYVSVDLYDM